MFGAQSDSAVFKKPLSDNRHLLNTQSALNSSRKVIERNEFTVHDLNSTNEEYTSAHQSLNNKQADVTPVNFVVTPLPVRQATSGLRNVKQIMSETVGKMFGASAIQNGAPQTYLHYDNVDSPPTGTPMDSFRLSTFRLILFSFLLTVKSYHIEYYPSSVRIITVMSENILTNQITRLSTYFKNRVI